MSALSRWGAALVVSLEAAPAPAAVQRSIEIDEPGRVAVVLDRDVYERARADLGDLRIIDESGRNVPYVLERAALDDAVASRRPTVVNRGFLRGGSAQVTLDFAAPTLKSELTLVLSGDNFRRRVVVEGRNRFESGWTMLTDSAYVFAVPPPAAARYETVALPENNFPLLRVTVEQGADDADRIEVLDVSARPAARRLPREAPIVARMARAEDPMARETILTLDLGARHQPFRGLVLDASDAAFFRGVVVEARIDSASRYAERQRGERGFAAPPLAWRYLGEGAVYRYDVGGEVREGRRLEVAGRERVLRLRVRNRDDAALGVRAVTVMAPVERLAFHAHAERSYVLRYGDPDTAPPTYDLSRTAGDPVLWALGAREARLLAAQAVSSPPPPAPPWTERHPSLLWSGLVAVVAALGAVTWRALKSAA